jgi:hypothetical protein
VKQRESFGNVTHALNNVVRDRDICPHVNIGFLPFKIKETATFIDLPIDR